jgi:hypothetical protein
MEHRSGRDWPWRPARAGDWPPTRKTPGSSPELTRQTRRRRYERRSGQPGQQQATPGIPAGQPPLKSRGSPLQGQWAATIMRVARARDTGAR